MKFYQNVAQTKMRAVKERAERDAQQYTHELKKLQRALDHQSHLKAFVATISAGEEDDLTQRRVDGECSTDSLEHRGTCGRKKEGRKLKEKHIIRGYMREREERMQDGNGG